MRGKPFWAGTAVSATHCGAGCVLGDLIAEWIVFAAGLQLTGFALPVEYPFDYVLAPSWGMLFQYFVIAPMRHLNALKAGPVLLRHPATGHERPLVTRPAARIRRP
jgi:hypothetical protein